MKIKGMPGEFGFKALVKWKKDISSFGLTTDYFFSLEHLRTYYNPDGWEVMWPVEVYEDGSVYIPAKEELEQ